ncbi:MAG: hypothetical protein ACC662_11990, partial [Planctomycetota bacterium]
GVPRESCAAARAQAGAAQARAAQARRLGGPGRVRGLSPGRLSTQLPRAGFVGLRTSTILVHDPGR